MNLKLDILRNVDGVITSQVWPDFSFDKFWWEFGNASCDCNRETWFLDAQGVCSIDQPECGDTRYAVRCSDADTGEVLYDEIVGE